ncbi:hypothetical protein BGZ76_010876 [Entomortierella beljakovae]|nr:hypothetical protein BGZ76_010876 [Entomortierella beljakovae]
MTQGQELQDNNDPWSPNQLQGVIVEPLRSPVNAKGEQMFAPEDSSEQRGVPWMLYRSRSHSTGALPYVSGNSYPSSTSLNNEGGNTLKNSFSKRLGGLSTVHPNNSSEYLSKISKITTKGDDNDSIVLPSSLKAATYNEGENSDQYDSCTSDDASSKLSSTAGSVRKHRSNRRSNRRNGSNRSGGKNQYSYYRGHTQGIDGIRHQQQQNESHGYDELAIVSQRIRSRACSIDNPSTPLPISTENLEAEYRLQPCNADTNRTQQTCDMYMDGMMNCSGPSTAYYSSTSHSPGSYVSSPHSTHSVSTMTSISSSIMSDLSLYSGLSQETSTSSGYSGTSISSTSTHVNEDSTCNSIYYSGDMNEKGYVYDNRQEGHHSQQQQQQQQQIEQDSQRCSNRRNLHIPKAIYSTVRFAASLFSRCDSKATAKKRASRTKASKHSKHRPTQQPMLTSSMYYIYGLHDLKIAKKKAGRWSKNSYANSGPDSKAFFSNERTYMHWIKFGLLLGSMALTLLNFGGTDSLTGKKSEGVHVGLVLVVVAMSTLVYGTVLFHKRHHWMLELRQDVKFYDRSVTMGKVFDEHDNSFYAKGLLHD